MWNRAGHPDRGDLPEDSTRNFVFSRVAENEAQVFVTAQRE
jgi:hypothetical protein